MKSQFTPKFSEICSYLMFYKRALGALHLHKFNIFIKGVLLELGSQHFGQGLLGQIGYPSKSILHPV